MPSYMLWLVDHPPYPDDWDDTKRAGVGGNLKALFDRVCKGKGSKYSSCSYSWASSNGARKPEHLVLHFFRRNTDGLLHMWRKGDSENSGATLWVPEKGAMVSEIYLEKMEGDLHYTNLVANLAFHEAMHNKLDAHPKYDSFDVHGIRHGGLSTGGNITAGTGLSSADIAALAPALGRSIPQW